MSHTLVIRRRAEIHAAEARDWYDQQRPGLGRDFVLELGAAIEQAHQHPLHYQIIYGDIRRVLLHRFPFAVFYVAKPDRVVVLAVLRQTDDPEKWRTIR